MPATATEYDWTAAGNVNREGEMAKYRAVAIRRRGSADRGGLAEMRKDGGDPTMGPGYPSFRRERSGRAWRRCWSAVVLFLLLLAADALPAAQAPVKGVPRAKRISQAIVTLVQGKALLLKGPNQMQDVRVGDELAEGARIRLEKSARLVLLWDDAATAVLQGPAQEITLAPTTGLPREMSPKVVAVARNVWRAVCSKLRDLRRGTEQPAKLTEESLAVRGGPNSIRAVYPANERIRPGGLTLRWGTEAKGVSLCVVSILDSNGATIWSAKTKAKEALVPKTVSVAPGNRYWWLVVGAENSTASMAPCWFETLTREQVSLLKADLERARELFKSVGPPSQVHLAVGCVLERYGLLSEAHAEYREAARLSPEIPAYKMLAGQQSGAAPPGDQAATPAGE